MKPPRPSLSRLLMLAAAQLCCGTFLSATALAANAPSGWSDLWRTPDQQGQALLDAGQPAQAADRFQDPRRRAYADLEASRYGPAAKLLARFTDARSEYNLGNALARSGQLQAALTAYDAALKQAPADRDIRHNRELVERALQQQHQSQASGRNGRQGGKAGSSQGRQSGQSSGRQGSSGSQRPGSGQTASNGAQAGASSSGHSEHPQSGQSGNPQGSSARQSADANPSRAQQAPTANGSGSSSEAPGQAQRDAAQAAALARARRQQGSNSAASAPDTGNMLSGGARTPKPKPETERQLALEQWLRQIPDNAAGLLQRKFLIEHMMRQQDGGDPQGQGGAQ